jgi:hypothetical protein
MSRQLAKVLHTALMGGVLVIAAVLAFVRTLVDVELEGSALMAIRYAGLGLLFVAGIVIFKLRARIPTHQPDQERDAWWAAHGQLVLVQWMLADGTATVGAVLWFLTGDVVPLVVLAAAAVLLFRLRPSVWTLVLH